SRWVRARASVTASAEAVRGLGAADMPLVSNMRSNAASVLVSPTVALERRFRVHPPVVARVDPPAALRVLALRRSGVRAGLIRPAREIFPVGGLLTVLLRTSSFLMNPFLAPLLLNALLSEAVLSEAVLAGAVLELGRAHV